MKIDKKEIAAVAFAALVAAVVEYLILKRAGIR